MSSFLLTIIIGIALSMDAFSLSLIYGTLNISYKNKIILSLIVGIYHFFMPLLGLYFGDVIENITNINLNILTAIIFLFIGLEIIINNNKEKDQAILFNLLGFILFGLSVSIDSFTTGIGLNSINDDYLEVSLTFFICSTMFTYLGLNLGAYLSKKIGNIATFIGGIILILLGLNHLF